MFSTSKWKKNGKNEKKTKKICSNSDFTGREDKILKKND